MIGTRLSHFHVTAKLGAGGMGEVYRAEDRALGREVAIKVLPAAVVADAERVARFEREARVLASLSHPNIASIFEVGHEDGTHFLVMELARGETLADRLARGPIPLDEALPIAVQIADALEAAHERGIVHRDLKLANVMLDPEGRVKVLDFGLAKALADASDDGNALDLSHSPTQTRGTVAGVLIGTAAYMSPEQAKGRPADRRSDVWAFGVVLWEMLIGDRLFSGETASDVLAAVLRADIDLSRVPASTPSSIRRVLRRCLARDPRQRLHDIADARLEIADAMRGSDEPLPRPARSPLRPVALGLAALGLAGALGWLVGRPIRTVPEPPIHLPVSLPDGFRLALHSIGSGGSVAISPDGRRLVVAAYGPDGADALVARDLGQVEPRVLDGTAEAQLPFFSPDGEWVGFFASGELRRVPFAGGSVERLAAASEPRGAAWGPDGAIYLAPRTEGGLFRLPPRGGDPVPLTRLDNHRGERTHRWPYVLPGGEQVLFTSDTVDSQQYYDDARIEVVTVASGERRVLVERASRAAYASTGHLLFARGGGLFAAPFDARRLEVTGEPERVLQGVRAQITTGGSEFAVSDTGALFYVPGGAEQRSRQPVWVKGRDSFEPTVVPRGLYFHLALAPDGRRVALARVGDRRQDIWISDLARGVLSRLTFEGGMGPVWTWDGRRIAYQRSTSATFTPQDSFEVVWRATDGSDEEQVIWKSETPISPNTFTRDGRALIVHRSEAPTAGGAGMSAGGASPSGPVSRDRVAGAADLWVVPLDGGEPHALFTAPGFQYAAEISPDGRWLAYLSDESGRYEVYVRPFPTSGGRWQVSASGGAEPHWSRDGTALYYRRRRELLRVPVVLGAGSFAAGPEEVVATGQIAGRSPRSYAIAPDGRILFLQMVGVSEVGAPVLVLGFSRELERSRR